MFTAISLLIICHLLVSNTDNISISISANMSTAISLLIICHLLVSNTDNISIDIGLLNSMLFYRRLM